ncbi:hypothetical protein GCM10010378_39500 [Streptomyces viridochromogenes]
MTRFPDRTLGRPPASRGRGDAPGGVRIRAAVPVSQARALTCLSFCGPARPLRPRSASLIGRYTATARND